MLTVPVNECAPSSAQMPAPLLTMPTTPLPSEMVPVNFPLPWPLSVKFRLPVAMEVMFPVRASKPSWLLKP